MRAPLATIERCHLGSRQVVTVRGEIDVANAPLLREWLAAARLGGARDVIVDLDRVRFMAVGALYVLCDEQEHLASMRRRLTVVCSRPEILKLLRVCRLEEVLHVIPSLGETPERWGLHDEARTARLRGWIERYERRIPS